MSTIRRSRSTGICTRDCIWISVALPPSQRPTDDPFPQPPREGWENVFVGVCVMFMPDPVPTFAWLSHERCLALTQNIAPLPNFLLILDHCKGRATNISFPFFLFSSAWRTSCIRHHKSKICRMERTRYGCLFFMVRYHSQARGCVLSHKTNITNLYTLCSTFVSWNTSTGSSGWHRLVHQR